MNPRDLVTHNIISYYKVIGIYNIITYLYQYLLGPRSNSMHNIIMHYVRYIINNTSITGSLPRSYMKKKNIELLFDQTIFLSAATSAIFIVVHAQQL